LPHNWIESRLQRLETAYKKGGQPREPLKEAFKLCSLHHIPLPAWVVDGVNHVFGSPAFDRHKNSLEKAYQAGNLGALKDMVYWCKMYQQPLPDWAVSGLYEAINTLATGNKPKLQSWCEWLKKYRQNMIDYEIYEHVTDAREHGAEWRDVYEIGGAIFSNKTEDEGGSKSNTIEKTYKRVVERVKNNPYQYKILTTFQKRPNAYPWNKSLWEWIEKTISTGKPKGIKKQQDN